jgi:rare lipoprotein A
LKTLMILILLTTPAAAQCGRATWYGNEHGQGRTALGKRYDPSKIICAHRTRPLGSWVTITGDAHGRCQILDRGPYTGAIIDLSRGAARAFGLHGRGRVCIR